MGQQKVVEPMADDVMSVMDELQPGTKLLKGQYTISRFLNNGGFGITYLAKDSLNRDVVIKECFPNAFCRRSKTVVAARSRAHQAELRSVVQLFVREAHSLAKMVHPNIVAVHQVFEDNGTAYMAIDYIQGRDLLEVIEDKSTTLSPAEIVNITEKMLSAVGFIHESDMLHRDISPDNILINKKGEPILIDFGAAREQASRKSRALTALRVVKDGYSPQEFYIAGSEQGPWSDLYALGATLYHAISGEAPINGQARLAALAENRPDPYQPLAGRVAGYPAGFLEAIDRVMNTIPKNRLQSAQDWLAMFKDGVMPVPVNDDALQEAVAHMIAETAQIADEPAAEVVPAAPAAAVKPKAQFAPLPDVDAPVAAKGGRKLGVPVIGAVAAVVVVAGLAITFSGGSSDTATTEPAAASAPTETAAAPAAATTEPAAPEATAEPAPATTAGEETAQAAPTDAAPSATETTETPAEEPTASAPEAAAEAAPQTETAEAAAPVIETPAAPVTGPVAENQIAFAAWDVRMPFSESMRTVDGKRVAVVSRIDPAADLSVVGSWLKPGVTLYGINDVAFENGGTTAGMVLNNLHVDPDGYSRVGVTYKTASGDEQSGLLAVPTVRIVSLANGMNVSAAFADGKWQTIVQTVPAGGLGSVQPGDVLFRDKTTGIAIDGPETIELVMAELAKQKIAVTEFSVVRDSGVETAEVPLALEAAQ
ncbi:serine/threonine-protein kinase [Frigidibacter sp. RF13]|uniref:serine/threonine-protein kinase n=1 Tax=Frigidibacter sp. RF13 TaxID=2997340 RepID=UPI00226E5EEE|nr:serine/threonine-protein kinase [Frigidibacter sp. RF13]MCY1128267.1 serine/threonine-protein kinase [Frigidibacter sp. RF13]